MNGARALDGNQALANALAKFSNNLFQCSLFCQTQLGLGPPGNRLPVSVALSTPRSFPQLPLSNQLLCSAPLRFALGAASAFCLRTQYHRRSRVVSFASLASPNTLLLFPLLHLLASHASAAATSRTSLFFPSPSAGAHGRCICLSASPRLRLPRPNKFTQSLPTERQASPSSLPHGRLSLLLAFHAARAVLLSPTLEDVLTD